MSRASPQRFGAGYSEYALVWPVERLFVYAVIGLVVSVLATSGRQTY